jgi:hypothetical protein
MKSRRSMWKVLFGVVGVGLLVTNCTIKTGTEDDACTPGKKKNCTACPGGVTGTQTCLDDGTFDACFCPDSNVGGASSAGASSAGAPSAGANNSAGTGGATTNGGAASAGEGGEGGATMLNIDPNDCYDCLFQLCAPEWDACVLEDENNPQDPSKPGDYCLSSKADGTGQIESILDCIEGERANGTVSREKVRSCGASLGQSSDPSFFLWPPADMTAATAGVINCMADAPDELNSGAWADSKNIPSSGAPKPWLDMTCAKFSCTSSQQ